MLTAAELLVAAEQADRYPAGYGGNWGHGPLDDAGTKETARRLRRTPILLAFC